MVRSLFDDTFAGIHQMAWFDWAMLIPYFLILAILSVYGLHRYDIIRTYSSIGKRPLPGPPSGSNSVPGDHPASALQRALRGGAAHRRGGQNRVSEGPASDSGFGRFHRRHRPFAEALVERYRALGHPIEYHHRATGTASRPARFRKGSKPRPESWWRCSTPIFARRPISSSAPSISSWTRQSAWCRPAGATSTAITTS